MELKRKVFASPVRGNMERIVFADDGSVDGVRFVKMATGRNHEKVFSNKKR
jgi:hypothetical protein